MPPRTKETNPTPNVYNKDLIKETTPIVYNKDLTKETTPIVYNKDLNERDNTTSPPINVPTP